MSPRPNVITPKAKKSILAKFPFSSSPPFFSPNRTCRTIFPESLPPTPFTKQGTWKNIAFRFRDILRGPLMPLWQAFFLWGGTPCFSSGLEDRGRKQLLLGWLGEEEEEEEGEEEEEEEEEEGKWEEEEELSFPLQQSSFSSPPFQEEKEKREGRKRDSYKNIPPSTSFRRFRIPRGTVIAPKFDVFWKKNLTKNRSMALILAQKR